MYSCFALKSQTFSEKKYGQFVCGLLSNLRVSTKIRLFASLIGVSSEYALNDEEVATVIGAKVYLTTHKYALDKPSGTSVSTLLC